MMKKHSTTPLRATYHIPRESNLSSRQYLIWLGQQLHPDLPLYNMMLAFKIAGPINPKLFQKAFEALISHSDVLRTLFHSVNGIPRRRLMTRLPYQMEILDFSQASSPQLTLEAWFNERCLMPFELEKRAYDSVLIKMADEQFIWYLNQHHIIVDAFSTALLYRRMMGYYKALLEGDFSAELPRHSFQQYIDYERIFSHSSLYQRGEAYWQEKLSKPTSPTRFYGHSPKRGLRIRRLACPIGAETSQAIREIAQAQDVRVLTPHLSLFNIFITLMAAYAYRVSGNKRLAIGAPFHNRHSGQFAETIGLLMQICPLHVEIADDDTFLSLLDKVKAETYSVMRHSQVSIGNSVHQQAFDLMLNYHRVSFPDFCDYPTEPLWLHSGYGDGNDNLAIQVHDFKESGEFVLHFDFNRAIFGEEQSRRAMGHFQNLLEAFIEDRAQKISHAKLLSPAERRELLVDFNQTATPSASNQTVVGLFEAQVRRTPHQIAVSCRGESLTYQQLNSRANQLAHHLQALGVGAEVLVAICMERESLMLIGILGILKAGGAYLPLDPNYPQERLKFMLNDAGKPILLSWQGLAEGLQEEAKLICLDKEQPHIASLSRENPIQSATAENLAYIIYTSGSTGQPKGIMIPHRGLSNYLSWAIEAYEVKDGKGAPVHSSISFDLTITSLFAPLLVGRQVELLPAQLAVEALSEALRHEKDFSLVKITPSHLELLAQQLSPEESASLRGAFIIGGEALSADLVKAWQERAPKMMLVNEYGPTETVVGCCIYKVPNDQAHHGSIPIGRPIANTQLYVLDQQLEPVPIGVPGELYIGGRQVARGYLNRPDLTAQKFILNPFVRDNEQEGKRLYKTGDLVRHLADGNLEFLGRIDHQVKIRGFRIELGEIEAVLSQHHAVRECVVIVREIKHKASANQFRADQRLVAYIVPSSVLCEQGKGQLSHELRTELKKHVPVYMLPSQFIYLSPLPLTPNGKIDRQALPVPDLGRAQDKNFVAPRHPKEEAISQIWAEVLGVAQKNLSIYDNFFELGGHSLLASQVIFRIQEELELNLEFSDLFKKPTIAELANERRNGKSNTPLNPLSRGE